MARSSPDGARRRTYSASSNNSKGSSTPSPKSMKRSPKSSLSEGCSPPQRSSPPAVRRNTPSPQGSRVSPGLLAGHYAGCKFTEPPLPSALPLPPQHWMQQPRAAASCTPLHIAQQMSQQQQGGPEQLAQSLKMLLKVHA